MTRFCSPFPALVGALYWLPPEPYEFGWAGAVGCNNLRCEHCGEPVRSEVPANGTRRRYACGCQQEDVVSIYRIGGESEDLYPALTGWICDGHPDLLLPTTLDGVRLDTAIDWDALVINVMHLMYHQMMIRRATVAAEDNDLAVLAEEAKRRGLSLARLLGEAIAEKAERLRAARRPRVGIFRADISIAEVSAAEADAPASTDFR